MSANISFSSGALQANDLIVTKLDGYEGLSQLFRYEVQVASQAINIDAQAVLAADATLGIKQGMALSGGGRGYRTVNINGVVCEFEQGEQVSKGWVSYRAVMVPHVWKLTRNVTSRVWIDKTTLQILEDLLAEHGLTGNDFEVRCNDSYPSRHFVMQYEESDFDFIARWLAHEGMFFYFEQSDEGEKLIVGDDTSAYKPVIGAATLAYNPSSQQSAEIDEGGGTSDWTAEEVVTGFNRKQQVSPKKVKLKDYNWMNTADALEVEADINQLQGGRGDSFGYGVQRVTNQNYQVGPEGVRLAKVRAGEHIAREVVFSGRSDCRSFQPGSTFSLASHYRTDFNAEYVLTTVRHTATQKISFAGLDNAQPAATSGTYRNTFTAIPAAVSWRAPQLPWPRIRGLLNAVIESTSSDGTPMMDSYGQFKVRLPIDVKSADKANGAASWWIRAMSATAGSGYGFYAPLRAGTEVLLSFIDGNPDRPIIVGSVANDTNHALVDSNNPHQTILQTVDGTRIVMEDDNCGLVMHNGGVNAITAYRNGAAGSPTTGAGYVQPPTVTAPGGSGGGGGGSLTSSRTGSRTMAPGAPVSGLTGGLTSPASPADVALNPRVGIFSGPLNQPSLDGGSLVPAMFHRDDDAGGGGATTVSPEEIFFAAHSDRARANLTTGFAKVGPGAAFSANNSPSASTGVSAGLAWNTTDATAYPEGTTDKSQTETAGSDFRDTAGLFEAAAHKYAYVCGNSMTVYDHADGEAHGTYVKGGDYNFYFDNAEGNHSTYIRAGNLNNELHLGGNNLVMYVAGIDSTGDQVWGPGCSEYNAFERQVAVTNTTGVIPQPVNAGSVAKGTIKETTIAHKIEEYTTVTTGEGKIYGDTTANYIEERTHANQDILEWTTCAHSMRSHTQAVTITEHQACVAHAEHFACAFHAEAFEGTHSELFFGAKLEIELGIRTEIVLAAALEVFLGDKLEVVLGNGVELKIGNYVECQIGTKCEIDCTTDTTCGITKTEVQAAAHNTVAGFKKIMSGLLTAGTP